MKSPYNLLTKIIYPLGIITNGVGIITAIAGVIEYEAEIFIGGIGLLYFGNQLQNYGRDVNQNKILKGIEKKLEEIEKHLNKNKIFI